MNAKRNRPDFNLRWRLVLLVTLELLLSVLIAFGLAELLNLLLPPEIKIPIYAELAFVSLAVGLIATVILSRVFFAPIRKLQRAMQKVSRGDFSVRLEEKSSSAEIRELYSHFNQMVQELGATEMLQSDFVANVSHEFKTPITTIEGYATLLQGSEGLNEEGEEYVEKILAGTTRLSGLVGSILLLSKLENQSIETAPTLFRLDEQIRAAVVDAEKDWSEKELELDVDLCRVEYLGAQSLLRHVWDNLISNAVKFNRRGGLLRLSLTESERQLCFVIENEGAQIPKEALNHIFDKFYQADTSHRQKGNGLGLALVKRICTLCHGEVSAENTPCGSVRFTVLLPKT